MSEMIPVNSLVRHVEPLSARLQRVTEHVIRSGYFVLGPNLSRFEQAFAHYCGVNHCIGVANGTDALELGLKAIGVVSGDEVALVANAAMYGTSAVLACGATPVFVDIDLDTHNMSPTALEIACNRGGIKAVIVTHLYGRLANMDMIRPICQQRGIKIMEDCAQAHGAMDERGIKAGAFGDAASFSFYPTKNLGALGDGGAIVTRDDAIAGHARQLRQYGWSAKYTNELGGGRNSRLDELQAALLMEMLPELDGWNARRREISNRYSKEIRASALTTPPEARADNVAHLYVVRAKHREEVRAALAHSGVHTEIHYPTPDYRQPFLANVFSHIHLEHCEHDASTVMTLPCFPEMTDQEISQVVAACNRL